MVEFCLPWISALFCKSNSLKKRKTKIRFLFKNLKSLKKPETWLFPSILMGNYRVPQNCRKGCAVLIDFDLFRKYCREWQVPQPLSSAEIRLPGLCLEWWEHPACSQPHQQWSVPRGAPLGAEADNCPASDRVSCPACGLPAAWALPKGGGSFLLSLYCQLNKAACHSRGTKALH